VTDLPPIEEQPEPDINAEPKAKQPHRWKKGESGNPTGMRPGSRHKASILAETLLDGETERLTRKCVALALEGEPVALRLCMERVLSPKKSRPLTFKLPVLSTVSDAQNALAALVSGVASGEILSDEAAILSNVINSFVKTLEMAELETRLAALEPASAAERAGVRFDA
jgi:hypothetical protein